MKVIITEKQYELVSNKLLMEGPIPSTLMKLFGAQTARKLEQIFAQDIDNIELYFAKITSESEKVLLTKAGQQYLKSSIGVEIPTSTLKTIMDLASVGKITKSNMEQYLNLLPEKFFNGSDFRGNIRKLLEATINRVEKGAGKVTAKTVNKTLSKTKVPVPQTISSSFKMAKPEESFKLAGWLDQKFYEAGNKRHSSITNAQFEKLLPETKEYLKKLYQRMKELFPGNINSRLQVKTERESIDAVTNNYWGGFGRQGKLVQDNYSNIKNTPSLPLPSKSVENDLNSIFPTAGNSQYGAGKNFWSSSN
jgi:hypothetical protein